MRTLLLRVWWIVLLMSCQGVSGDPGLSADLIVPDAQFVRGAMPSSPSGGPAITAIVPPRRDVQAGGRTDRVSGSTEPAGTAVLLELAGDEGHWIVSTGAATLAEPDLPTFDAMLGFARGLDGPVTLRLRAVDARGRVGPAETLAFDASPVRAAGQLVVTLSWDSEADLDLHVRDPLGEEVWAGNINSAKRTPVGAAPVDRNAWMNGGILDVDANAACVQDSRRRENVSWSAAPPSGAYEVRVATASICQVEAAHWTVEVFLQNRRLLTTRGTALGSDTRAGAQRGDGVQAASFTVP